jgi:hypothetical protein
MEGEVLVVAKCLVRSLPICMVRMFMYCWVVD